MGMSLGSSQSVQTLRETDVWWHMHRLLYLQEWMERHRYHTHTSRNTCASQHFSFDCRQQTYHILRHKSHFFKRHKDCVVRKQNIFVGVKKDKKTMWDSLDTVSMISKDYLRCGLVRPKNTVPLCSSISNEQRDLVYFDNWLMFQVVQS